LKHLAALLPAAAAAGSDLDKLKELLGCVRLLCRIFFSLNSPGLTPVSPSERHPSRALAAWGGSSLLGWCEGLEMAWNVVLEQCQGHARVVLGVMHQSAIYCIA
jgi:hypothetical protein